MAVGVPPPPLNSPNGSYYWLEWYTNLTNFLNGSNIPWANLNFVGSDIADIQTRKHNSLTNIQGGNASGTRAPTGNAWHLLGAEFLGYVSAAGTAVQLPAGWTVGGGNPYTITHNLSLTSTTYAALVMPSSGTGFVQSVVLNADTFVVTLSAANSFTFVVTQGS